MKHIALVSHHAGDMLRFRGYLIQDLVASGWQVSCLAPDYVTSNRDSVSALGANAVPYSLQRNGMNPLRDIIDTVRLWGRLRRLRPDVVLSFSTKPMLYGTLAAWVAHVPKRMVIVEGAGYLFTRPVRQSCRRRALRTMIMVLYRSALRQAHRVIFLNRDDQLEFVGQGLVQQKQALLLGGIGVDLQAWPQTAPAMGTLCFLMVARLLREKGVVEFAEAARRIKAQYPQVRFCLLGKLDTNPGALKEEQIQAWVNDGIVEWPGFVAVQPWLDQASVFVLPSYREGLPLSTQEAMAVGRPIITTDVPGCRETVREGTNGFLIPARDVEALASAMRRFIEQPEQIQTMGNASRRMAEEAFDVHTVNQKLLGWIVD